MRERKRKRKCVCGGAGRNVAISTFLDRIWNLIMKREKAKNEEGNRWRFHSSSHKIIVNSFDCYFLFRFYCRRA